MTKKKKYVVQSIENYFLFFLFILSLKKKKNLGIRENIFCFCLFFRIPNEENLIFFMILVYEYFQEIIYILINHLMLLYIDQWCQKGLHMMSDQCRSHYVLIWILTTYHLLPWARGPTWVFSTWAQVQESKDKKLNNWAMLQDLEISGQLPHTHTHTHEFFLYLISTHTRWFLLKM
jgi:hypothetical protein